LTVELFVDIFPMAVHCPRIKMKMKMRMTMDVLNVRYRTSGFGVALVGLLLAVACGSSAPLSPTHGGLTTSIAAPTPLAPASGTMIRYSAQPVTLVVQNAVLGQSGSPTYTVEISTDSAFASVVRTKDGVAEGGNGQTSIQLDMLDGGKDYYWHVRAIGGGTTGVYSTASKFTIGAAVSLNAPVPVNPLNGSVQDTRPPFVVANAGRTGPAGPITYKYEIADNPAFSPALITALAVAESPTQTTFTPSSDLPTGKTLYWRATATDQTNAVSSGPSATQSFTCSLPTVASVLAAQEGMVLWPGARPTGTPGHAVMNDEWYVHATHDFLGVPFVSPLLDALRVFDLLDRGMTPGDAIGWMFANGYPTEAYWYPDVAVVGFPQEYMYYRDGVWGMFIKVGA
jgi:hypothetical protein